MTDFDDGTIATTVVSKRLSRFDPKSIGLRMLSWRAEPVLAENCPVILLVTGYLVLVRVIQILHEAPWRMVMVTEISFLVRLTLSFAAVFIALAVCRKTYRLYFTSRYLTGFLIVVVLMSVLRFAYSSFKQTIPTINPFQWDRFLMNLDFVLHFRNHPWRLLQPILSYESVVVVIDRLYMIWFFLLFLFCLWMGWSRLRRLRLQFMVTTILVWCLLGSALGTVLSSAGPCYYSKVSHMAEDPFAPLMVELDRIDRATFLWARYNQVGLWDAYQAGECIPYGGISAMPSIHISMATVFALVTFRVRRWLGLISLAYLFAIQIGSVILGWHYAVDGYLGIVLTCMIWYCAGTAIERLAYNGRPPALPGWQ